MDKESLAGFDGKEGRPAYIVHDGKVYDVSGSPLWPDGVHMCMHRAGRDLTDLLSLAPHGPEVLKTINKVDTLSEPAMSNPAPGRQALKKSLSMLYKRFHPHPVSIHFPIALFVFSAILDILYLLFERPDSLAPAVFYAFLAATIATPVAMATGFLSWWLNYDAQLTPIFTKKIVASVALMLTAAACLCLRMLDPAVVDGGGGSGWLYHMLLISTWPLVTFTGYQGGKITFPG